MRAPRSATVSTAWSVTSGSNTAIRLAAVGTTSCNPRGGLACRAASSARTAVMVAGLALGANSTSSAAVPIGRKAGQSDITPR